MWLAGNEYSTKKYFTEKVVPERTMCACLYFHLVGHGKPLEIKTCKTLIADHSWIQVCVIYGKPKYISTNEDPNLILFTWQIYFSKRFL